MDPQCACHVYTLFHFKYRSIIYKYFVSKPTVPSGAPQNVSASPTSPFEAYLSWSPPLEEERNGVIDNYVINITEDDTGDKFQVSTSTTTITLDENLRPYYVYTCVIAAETSVGVGPYSSNVSFRTHEYGRSNI